MVAFATPGIRGSGTRVVLSVPLIVKFVLISVAVTLPAAVRFVVPTPALTTVLVAALRFPLPA